ncbi:hypothetical protein K431DRAFT_295059 [Polychaeton citri CBS 116435]|uniref:ORC6 first cyclin-like domain-containing protein n=1 Tax=Polychaeton citri CBS 116435 TaxID=1314669 RepID=A0A9P4Q905_9PEZI|nr:hypothetical protein K431DRAFT_295059 [Polychaeton citri CBS 116435]
MPTPIESALATLLPTIAFLPPELISLSSSLLAQSRGRAATLKQDEEIARTYACCHIACERLAKKLDLEIGRPTPPVKPRTYSKLKSWLEEALRSVGSNPATPQMPGGRHRDLLKTPTSRAGTIRKTPLSKAFIDAASTLPSNDIALPSWTKGMSTSICAHFQTPELQADTLAAAGAVYRSGKSEAAKSSQTPGSKRKRTAHAAGSDFLADGSVPMLIAVIHASLVALSRAEAFDLYNARERNKMMLFVMDYYDNDPTLFGEGPDAKEIEQALDHWSKQATNIWPATEWYQIALRNSSNSEADETGQDTNEDQVRPKPHPKKTPLMRKEKHGGRPTFDGTSRAGLSPGLGTMFQPAVDWLSPERCAEFSQWKRMISLELEAIASTAP